MKNVRRLEAIESRLTALETTVGRLTLRITSSAKALSYPEPLANCLARESSARLHHEKFFSMIDTGEACIQYSAAIAIALCAIGGRPVNLREALKQPISLGKWVEIIRDSLTWEGFPSTTIGQALKSAFYRQNGTPTPTGRYLLDEFINLRNSERGHGSSLPDESYERIHLRHKTEFHDALESCTHLTFPLVRVETVDVAASDFSYDIRLLVGLPPFSSTERIQSTSRVRVGTTCVWDGAETLLDLGEAIVYRSCPVCDVEHTFFLERWTAKMKWYHAYLGNHRFKEEVKFERR